MATKYVNFVSRKRVSGGLALGGGVGKLDAGYTRHNVFFLGTRFFVEANQYNRAFPPFEILAWMDVRPAKFVSVGPYYGIRNGTLALGIAVRTHASGSPLQFLQPSSFTTEPTQNRASHPAGSFFSF